MWNKPSRIVVRLSSFRAFAVDKCRWKIVSTCIISLWEFFFFLARGHCHLRFMALRRLLLWLGQTGSQVHLEFPGNVQEIQKSVTELYWTWEEFWMPRTWLFKLEDHILRKNSRESRSPACFLRRRVYDTDIWYFRSACHTAASVYTFFNELKEPRGNKLNRITDCGERRTRQSIE